MVYYPIKQDGASLRLSKTQIQALNEIKDSPCGYVSFVMLTGKTRTASGLITAGLCEESPFSGVVKLTTLGERVESRVSIHKGKVKISQTSDLILTQNAQRGPMHIKTPPIEEPAPEPMEEELGADGDCVACGEPLEGEEAVAGMCVDCAGLEKCRECGEALPCSCEPTVPIDDSLPSTLTARCDGKVAQWLIADTGEKVALTSGVTFLILTRNTARSVIRELLDQGYLPGEDPIGQGLSVHPAPAKNDERPAPPKGRRNGWRKRTGGKWTGKTFSVEELEVVAKGCVVSGRIATEDFASRLSVGNKQACYELDKLRSYGIVEGGTGDVWTYVPVAYRPKPDPAQDVDLDAFVGGVKYQRLNGKQLWTLVEDQSVKITCEVRRGRENRMPRLWDGRPMRRAAVRSVTRDQTRCKISFGKASGWVMVEDLRYQARKG